MPNFTNFNQSIINLSKFINEYLCTKSDELKLRTKKTTIIDGILFKLLSQKNSTYDKATIKLNYFTNKDASTIAYYNRADNLSIQFYKDFYDVVSNKIDEIFYNINKQHIILVVDGTRLQFKELFYRR